MTAYVQRYATVETIRVSEEYHEWLAAHRQDGETIAETLRRMTRGPHPDDIAGLLSAAEADGAESDNVDEFRALDVPVESY